MKDKEIEVKFIINEKVKEMIINDLCPNKNEIFEKRQIDTYYIPNFKSFEIDGETIECVRIRETNNKVVLTYKKIHKEANPIYCDEYEVVLSDKYQMEKILISLGFSVQMTIDKTRQSFKKDNYEFDFDSVKNLGELLEIELKDENADIGDVFNCVSKYGLSEKQVTHEGIQDLMKKRLLK